ncbi:MAG: RNA methyltransferase [Sulfurifustis sp.]
MELRQAIRVVLVRPSHPGNVGGVARAMKNMGLDQLRLVAPSSYPSPEAEARAADAADILARAVVCAELDEAIGTCHFIVGTTARSRRIEWPALNPADAAARLLQEAERGPVAVLFGHERTGLTNAELDRCHALVSIPANPEYPSLNLACAVQILAYEIYRAGSFNSAGPANQEPPATEAEMAHFYRHLEGVLLKVGFLDPANPRLLMRRLHRLFNRSQLDRNEVNILRGILTSVERATDTAKRGGR